MTQRITYLCFALLFTLFFALFILSYQDRTVTAENSIRIEIVTKKPNCEATLWADDTLFGIVKMSEDCNVVLIKD